MHAALAPTAADVLFTGDLNGDLLACSRRRGDSAVRQCEHPDLRAVAVTIQALAGFVRHDFLPKLCQPLRSTPVPEPADGAGWFTPDQEPGPMSAYFWAELRNLPRCEPGSAACTGAQVEQRLNAQSETARRSTRSIPTYIRRCRSVPPAPSIGAGLRQCRSPTILAQSGVPAGNQKLGVRSPIGIACLCSRTRTASGSRRASSPPAAAELNALIASAHTSRRVPGRRRPSSMRCRLGHDELADVQQGLSRRALLATPPGRTSGNVRDLRPVLSVQLRGARPWPVHVPTAAAPSPAVPYARCRRQHLDWIEPVVCEPHHHISAAARR